MTWQQQWCLVGVCDGCGTSTFGGEDEYVAIFRDRDDGVEALTGFGWTATGDRLLCPGCIDQAACALIGHQWSPWQHRVGIQLRDGRTWTGRTRTCWTCTSHEHDPPPQVRQP